MYFDPKEEGITHINIYSKAQSPLGRYMSNFDRCHITISIGDFASIEGLIFYLGSFNEKLRDVSGANAKALGNIVDRNIRLPEDVFRRFVVEAMEHKVDANGHLRHLLETCDLPFTHYYVYGNKKVEVQGWDWQVQEWDKIRKRLREDYEQRKARNP
jgi:hypothetical protein